MGYKVIHYFEDLQDFNHSYKPGDIFPRLGMKVSEDRLKELSSSNNRQKKPLIKADANDANVSQEVVKREYTKREITRMSTSDLQVLASKQGIADADGMTGADLKKILIEKFGL
mgnify:FL=1